MNERKRDYVSETEYRMVEDELAAVRPIVNVKS